MQVQTVTGPIGLHQLGRTLMHEHLFIAFSGAEFDPTATFDRPGFVAEAVRRLKQLRTDHGVRSFVDPCPIELGRDAALMKEIAEKSEMNVVCTTGFYFEEMGLPIYWRARTVEEIAELYIREITHGIGDTGVRAGAIKVATGAPAITALEQKFLDAACVAQKATGVPIITHTQDGHAGPEQQAAFAKGGVPAHRCLIGHCCGNADPAYHQRVVDGGSYIGFDRIGLLRFQPDEVRADNLVRLVRNGYRGQIMMSQDRHCGWFGKYARQVSAEEQARMDALRAVGQWPPPYTYLFTDFVPMLKERGLSDAEIFSMLDDNPRRFFGGETLPRA
ncbi:MAG TPA: phosphotriesterase-related protein [Acetobacteraceae bacterium]|jgi:phosphotriesterase-related protein|nr:phosphotriesterase-related protein [Acetobacteraceae bacterium]